MSGAKYLKQLAGFGFVVRIPPRLRLFGAIPDQRFWVHFPRPFVMISLCRPGSLTENTPVPWTARDP